MTFRDLRLPATETEPPGIRTRAAVAVVLGPDDHLLFIRRAERQGDPWSGHMAFPGGRASPLDASIRATAERETREEVGLDLAPAEFIGALPIQESPLRDPQGGFAIHPYVFRVPVWPALTPLASEVAAIHLLDGRRLLAGEGRGEFRYQGYGLDRMLPCIRLEGTFIWGLTLRMIDQIAERLGAAPAPPFIG
jgi:8-oxo-dGTP pyrophosphatase MutT (NUDIX family)